MRTLRPRDWARKTWYAAGGLYLIAYCHLRRDVRLFAVERIQSLSITDHPYQYPLSFDIEAYVRDALMVMRGRPITVELVFDKKTAAWVKDKVWHPSQKMTRLRDGRLCLMLQTGDTQELVGWILSFGSGAQVVSPPELRQKILDQAKNILNARSPR